MNFGELLDEWEKLSARPGGLDAAAEAESRARREEAEGRLKRVREAEAGRKAASRQSLESWLAGHEVPDKDAGLVEEGGERGVESRRLAALRPGARIDLHGKTAAEAEYALGLFLEDAARRGVEKVLVITGKGNHSADGPVLGKTVRRFLERNPRAGRFGQAVKAEGGSGALWVLVRLGPLSRGG